MVGARFRFRLQRLLDLREQEVRRRRAELAEAQAAAAAAAAAARATEEQRRAAAAAWLARAGLGARPWEWELARGHLEGLRGRVAALRAEAEEWAAEEGRRRARVVAARAGQRSLERLRERQAEAHRLEVGRVEQAVLDEMGVTRAVRRGKGLP